MKYYAIGDIHGNFVALKNLVECISPTKKDTVIFLGDYVDRGASTKEVIEYVIKLREKTNVISLRGNHEVMMQTIGICF